VVKTLGRLFDVTWDQSIQTGVADLETAMAAHGNDHLVIYGYSQGAVIANLEKQRLAEQFPAGTTAPNIDFVLSEDLNLPNGGLLARFPGLYIPILDWTFKGSASTDTQFDTVEINRQYDGFADFPVVSDQRHRRPVRDPGRLLCAHVPIRRQPGPGSRRRGFPGRPWRHQLLLLRDREPAVVRSAAHTGSARGVDRRDRAVLPGAGGTGL
jgi:PE-PPE domain